MTISDDDLKQIRYVAHGYAKKCTFLTEEDLFQEGVRYWLEKGLPKCTKESRKAFVSLCVMGYISTYIVEHESLIRIPVHIHRIKGGDPRKTWRRYSPVETMDDLSETISCSGIFDTMELMISVRAPLEKAMNLLTDREREVVTMRYGLVDDNQQTLERIANRFGVTRERVRQIEQKALRKLHANKQIQNLEGIFD